MEAFTDCNAGDLIDLHIKNNNVEQIKWLLDNHYDTYNRWIFDTSIRLDKMDITNLFISHIDKIDWRYFMCLMVDKRVDLFTAFMKLKTFDDLSLINLIESASYHTCGKAFSILYDLRQLNDYQVISILARAGRVDWICDKFKDNAMIKMIKNGDLNGMVNLIDDGLDINMYDGCVLSLCIAFEKMNLINLLMNNNVAILHSHVTCVSTKGNLEILRHFFGAGLSRGAIDDIFLECVMHGHYDCVLFLINNVIGLNIGKLINSSLRHPKIFDLLVQNGADSSAVSLHGKKVHVDVVKKLYDWGVIDALAISKIRLSADDPVTIKFALDIGVDISSFDVRGIISSCDMEVMKMLLSSGSSPPSLWLQDSMYYVQYETSKLLLEHGAEISDEVIDECINTGNVELFKLLLKFDADIERNGMKNFMRAVKENNVEVVKIMLDRGVDRGDNEYLLSICQKMNYIEMANLLAN